MPTSFDRLGTFGRFALVSVAAASVAGSTQAAPASATAFGPLPDGSDALRLQQARNFMNNTLNTFVGALGTSALLTRIERAEGHAELRQLFDEWYYAIVTSREGRRAAESLRGQLLKVI